MDAMGKSPARGTENTGGTGVTSGRDPEAECQARLAAQNYYHGLLPREDVENILVKDGDFLVRKTVVKRKVQLVISLRLRICRHIVIVKSWSTAAGGGGGAGPAATGDKAPATAQSQSPQGDEQATQSSDGAADTVPQPQPQPQLQFFVTADRRFNSVTELIEFYSSACAPALTADGAHLRRAMARKKWQLSHDELTLCNKLGHGAFGDVYKGALCKKGARHITVAVKTLKVQHTSATGASTRGPSKRHIAELAREARIMRQYKHANVTRCYGLAAQETPIMVVMEFCEQGALDSHLRKGLVPATKRRTEFYRFCVEAAKGLSYLESRGCIHRDVAARNCLLSADGTIKISDFGLSAISTGAFKEQSKVKLPVRWLAPETLNTLQYSSKTDVWSYGILVWEIYSFAMNPYAGLSNDEVKSKVIHEKYRMTAADCTPTLLRRVIYACWHEEPHRRPDFKLIAKLIEKPHRYYPNQV